AARAIRGESSPDRIFFAVRADWNDGRLRRIRPGFVAGIVSRSMAGECRPHGAYRQLSWGHGVPAQGPAGYAARGASLQRRRRTGAPDGAERTPTRDYSPR